MYPEKHALQRVHLTWLGHKITETALHLTRVQEPLAISC